MSKQTKRGGLQDPPGGRPPLPPELKRVRCGDITIPTWLHNWLMSQSEPAGHIVEAALIEKYNPTPPSHS